MCNVVYVTGVQLWAVRGAGAHHFWRKKGRFVPILSLRLECLLAAEGWMSEPPSPWQHWAARSTEERQVWSPRGRTAKQHKEKNLLQSLWQTAGRMCELRWPFSSLLSTRVITNPGMCSSTLTPQASHLRTLLHPLPSFFTSPVSRRSSGLWANSILWLRLECRAGAPPPETWTHTNDAKARKAAPGSWHSMLSQNLAVGLLSAFLCSPYVWKGLGLMDGVLRLLSPL